MSKFCKLEFPRPVHNIPLQGSGGPYSEFNLREIGNSKYCSLTFSLVVLKCTKQFDISRIEEKYVALESAFYPDQHVGIREDGELQVPEKTPPLDRAALFIPFFHSSPTPTAVSSS